jgi:hypothetical protein
MLCNCKEICFTYESTKRISGEKCGTYKINKCSAMIFSDCKKKKKCDFFQETLIREFIIEKINKRNDLTVTSTKKKPDYLSRLNWNIHLYEMINEANKKTGIFDSSIANYAANINYLLKILNYKLFFEDREGIKGLKLRLKGPPDNIKAREKNIYPVVLVDIPEYLKPNVVHSIKKQKVRKSNKKPSCKLGSDIFEKLDEEGKEIYPLNKNEDSDEEKEGEEEEEEEEDEENDEDGGFDIDDNVSDNEDSYGDGGDFSD